MQPSIFPCCTDSIPPQPPLYSTVPMQQTELPVGHSLLKDNKRPSTFCWKKQDLFHSSINNTNVALDAAEMGMNFVLAAVNGTYL